MKLLTVTEHEIEEFERLFEEVETADIRRIAPEVIDGEPDIKIGGESLEKYDAAYLEIPAENAIFGRVMLEMLEEKDVRTNYPSTGFFTMAKKNYLFYVLQEKGIPAPKTAVIADEKASRKIENHLKGPLVARKFDNLVEVERTKIDTVGDIGEFSEGLEYGENMLVFQELRNGDRYRCLVAGDEVISLQDDSEGWEVSENDLKYSNISKDLRETVMETKNAIGTRIAEVVLRDGIVVDVNPNPDLEMYTEISGKNAYEAVARTLRPEE